MRGDLVARRFTDEETRWIFERAAETEARSRPPASQTGHTLEELRAIASEVGLDPAAVDRAAAEVVTSAADGSASRHLGWSRLVQEDAVIAKPLSNVEMRGLVSQVEQIIGRRGLLSDAGPWVEWRDHKDQLYVGMVRGDERTRLRAIADCSGDILVGFVAMGVLGLLVVAGMSGSGWFGHGLVIAAAVAAAGFFIRHRVAVRQRDLRELLEILKDTAGR